MKGITRSIFCLLISVSSVGCQTETEVCNGGEAAKLYYMPQCATINGYITLEDKDKTFVFQHEIDEEFHGTGIEVCVRYAIQEPEPLTAECTTAEIVVITSLRKRK